MGMDTAQAPESADTEPESTQVGNQDTLLITHNDVGHLASPGDEDGNLSLYFG